MQDFDSRLKILIVDDEVHAQLANERVVTKLCAEISSIDPIIKIASSLPELKSALSNDEYHLVLLDKDLGPDETSKPIDGIDLIPMILEVQPHARVILITGFRDSKLAVKAIENGATDFITKAETEEERKYRDSRILKAIKEARLELETLRKKYIGQEYVSGYVCKSDAMKLLDINLHQLAEVPTPVLILGESGLGKTHTAKRLHELTKKFKKDPKRTFANININSLSDNLLLSELFGHEKGAFTGANETKKGLFEICRDGDLFLDEIGDASPAVQGALLKVICEKEFCRVGSSIPIKTKARLIFATNKDLEVMMKAGQFRSELYGRMCSAKIQMPKLIDRKKDIPYICQNLTDLLKEESGKNISFTDFPATLKNHFQRDYIPFNIRGIKSDLERIMIYSPIKFDGDFDYRGWRKILSSESNQANHNSQSYNIDNIMELLVERMGSADWPGLHGIKDKLEEKILLRVQEKFSTNKTRAKVLGVSESLACMKMKKYNTKYKADGTL